MNIWIYLLIVAGGILQTCGAPMNGQLYKSLTNPWLASLVSFLLIVALFICLSAMFPTPTPTLEGIRQMPWWAPLGGIVGAVQVYAGLMFVGRVGAGNFMAITVSSALIASIVIDQFGWFRLPVHPISLWRGLGAVLLIGGVVLITRK